MRNDQLPMTNDPARRDASCAGCGQIVALTRAGQLRRHRNQLGNVCHGVAFSVRPDARGHVQLTLIVKGGAV